MSTDNAAPVGLAGDIVATLARADIDLDRLSSRPGHVPIVLDASDGGWIEITTVLPATNGGGWAYTRFSAAGAVTESGGQTAPELHDLVVSLRPHLVPLPYPGAEDDARSVEQLRRSCAPSRQHPMDLHPANPAARWLLALFITWKDLQEGGDGVCGSDLTEEVDLAFERIGLGSQVSLQDIAARVDRIPATTVDHPAVAAIATHLLDHDCRHWGVRFPARSAGLAREITDRLDVVGLLAPYPPRPAPDPGRPNLEDRAGWAVAALDALAARSAAVPCVVRDPDQLRAAAAELIAALLHLGDRAGLDPEQVLSSGQTRHRMQAGLDHDPQTCTVPGCSRCRRLATTTTDPRPRR